MKFLRFISRLFVGVVFVFSGFVKAVDPLGSAYKFSDYFSAFGLDFLKGTALPLAIIMSTIELALGLTIILGYRKKQSYWLLMIFMSFFTILTFILAIFNPVSDCGCFGDALILTNWQTFFKNVILMLFVLLLFADRNRKYPEARIFFEWGAIALIFAAGLLISINSYKHLPLIDFRPFALGTNISEAMSVPDDAPVDQYETILYYRDRESGKKEGFSLQNYPKDTLAWEFVDTESKLIKKGYEAPIHDFALMDPFDEDVTNDLLSYPGYSLLMIAHNIESANSEALKKGNEWSGLEKIAEDYKFYAISSSAQKQLNSAMRENGLSYNFHVADEIMLKTIVRSNPGFILIKDGTIIGKWAWRDFPDMSEIDKSWEEMIITANEPLDEEQQMLMEAGVFDDINYGVVKTDQSLMKYLFSRAEDKNTSRVSLLFLLLGLLVLSTLRILTQIKSRRK